MSEPLVLLRSLGTGVGEPHFFSIRIRSRAGEFTARKGEQKNVMRPAGEVPIGEAEPPTRAPKRPSRRSSREEETMSEKKILNFMKKKESTGSAPARPMIADFAESSYRSLLTRGARASVVT